MVRCLCSSHRKERESSYFTQNYLKHVYIQHCMMLGWVNVSVWYRSRPLIYSHLVIFQKPLKVMVQHYLLSLTISSKRFSVHSISNSRELITNKKVFSWHWLSLSKVAVAWFVFFICYFNLFRIFKMIYIRAMDRQHRRWWQQLGHVVIWNVI